MESETFWDYLNRLVVSNHLTIDRPKNSQHPRYPDVIYPLDYGFLEGTSTVDGGGVDVWVGSIGNTEITGVVLTVDLLKSDTEIKVLLGCSDEDIQKILDFHNGNKMRAMLVRKISSSGEN
jgi:inorganic pyrophosphatase